jgi:hypothetical protein
LQLLGDDRVGESEWEDAESSSSGGEEDGQLQTDQEMAASLDMEESLHPAAASLNDLAAEALNSLWGSPPPADHFTIINEPEDSDV